MYDYIKNNSNTYRNKCSCDKFQSYNASNFGQNVSICTPNTCAVKQICRNNQYKFQQYVLNQQNLYAMMRRFPEKFPITSYVKNMNLTPQQQRAYSNMWYRQFGTSQALPVNDNWGGFTLVGSEVPYTN